MEISTTKQFDLHRRMVRIRLFEEAAGRLAEANRLPGFLHLYVGEEAVASGVCGALNDDDPSLQLIADMVTSSLRAVTSIG